MDSCEAYRGAWRGQTFVAESARGPIRASDGRMIGGCLGQSDSSTIELTLDADGALEVRGIAHDLIGAQVMRPPDQPTASTLKPPPVIRTAFYKRQTDGLAR
jgi:hypothetical protein